MGKQLKDNAKSINKATIELIQEDRFTRDGFSTIYYLNENGLYVDNSLCNDEESAKVLFQAMVQNGALTKKTVVLSKVIEKGVNNG